MDAAEVIRRLGGTQAVARLFNIKPPSVSEWKKKNEIPPARLQFIAFARPDALVAMKPGEAANG